LNPHDRNGNVPPVADPVSITGVGVVSPFGDDREAFRDALLSGASGIAPSAQFEAFGCRSVLAARVAGFDPARWIPPMKLRRMDGSAPFALAAIRQAMDEARYAVVPEGDERTGVVVGTYTAGGQATNEYLAALFDGGPMGAPALLFNSTVANAAAGLAGLEFKLQGPNATISQKEASGLAAIASAVDLLRAGRADAIASGGMDALNDVFYRAHDQFEVMNAEAAFGSAAAPFDAGRSGFVLGEGGFGLWLERGDGWRARGARAYGEILGIGAASATVPLNAWPDRAGPLVRTMRLALEEAGVEPADIGVVYASANASRGLDEVEARAIGELFGSPTPVITSIKGALGESGASGAAACVAAVLCGREGAVPPIAGLSRPDAAAGGLNLARSRTAAPAGLTLVNSFASGGALVSAVLRIAR
jgi:3-oxoacyl-[acyl-carrier-protein] synthase II